MLENSSSTSNNLYLRCLAQSKDEISEDQMKMEGSRLASSSDFRSKLKSISRSKDFDYKYKNKYN